MKKVLLLAAGFMAATSMANAQWMITMVIDGGFSGGNPKAVEIKNVSGSAIDLSSTNYFVNYASNGNTTVQGSNDLNALTGGATIAAGDYIIVENTGGTIATAWGAIPANVTVVDGNLSVNGDDAIVVSSTADFTGTIDTYGDVGTDGTTECWNHEDGWAIRNGNGEDTTFVCGEWTFSGTNQTDGETTSGSYATLTGYALGSNTSVPVELDSFMVE